MFLTPAVLQIYTVMSEDAQTVGKVRARAGEKGFSQELVSKLHLKLIKCV